MREGGDFKENFVKDPAPLEASKADLLIQRARKEGVRLTEAEKWEIVEEIIVSYRGKMMGLINRILGYMLPTAEVEDVFSEIMLKVYKGLDAFRGESSLSHWVLTVTYNFAIQTYRSSLNDPVLKGMPGQDDFFLALQNDWDENIQGQSGDDVFPQPDRELNPEQRAIENQKGKALLQAIEKLPKKYKEPFLLRYREGMEIFEIADKLDLKESVVALHIFRAREMLKTKPTVLKLKKLYSK